MENDLTTIIIVLFIVFLIIFLIVYNTKNNNNGKENKTNNNNEENKNEIVFSPKNFFEIGLSFGFGVLAAEIFLIAIICFIYKLFQ